MLQYRPTKKAEQIKIVPDNVIGLFKPEQTEWIKKYCANRKGVKLKVTKTYWLISFDSLETQNKFLKNFSNDLKSIS